MSELDRLSFRESIKGMSVDEIAKAVIAMSDGVCDIVKLQYPNGDVEDVYAYIKGCLKEAEMSGEAAMRFAAVLLVERAGYLD